jgi:membrane associated rhomboid family serine protease
MFIPLHDDTPLRVIRFQWMTLGLIVINVAVFLFTTVNRSEDFQGYVGASFGLTPYDMWHRHVGPIPERLTLVTYEFLHGGWLHLIGNMLFLWVFADNVEDAFGRAGFLVLYFICGIMGGLVHVLILWNSGMPLIGASGSVSGILAAYVLLFPRARVWILLFMRIPVPLPAIWVIGSWVGVQFLSLFWHPPGQDIAWWSHIGGFLAGLAITSAARPYLMKRLGRRV